MITTDAKLAQARASIETVCSRIYEASINGRETIIKVPKLEQVRKLEVEAFRAIAQRRERLVSITGKTGKNPHLVEFIDEIEFEDGKGFVLEKLNGVELPTFLQRRNYPGGLSAAQKLDIMNQIMKGIEEVHEAGVLNRDIKTQNIIMARSEAPSRRKATKYRAVVYDFGIAVKKNPKTAEEIEEHGKISGTAELFAPEIFEIDRFTASQDIYAAGALMYEIMTLKLFRKDMKTTDFAKIKELIKEEIPRPNAVAQVERDIEEIIMMAIAKDPSKRFRSATQMREIIFDALLRRTGGEIEF
jgi:serine/threonine-protein kinase